jgi:hypothetical protein
VKQSHLSTLSRFSVLPRSFFRGVEGNLLEYFHAAKAAGKSYEGIECPWQVMTPEAKEQVTQARAEMDLEYSAVSKQHTRKRSCSLGAAALYVM